MADLDTGRQEMRHRAKNHVGRKMVQRHAGKSGPVTKYVPGTPDYEALISEKSET